MASRSRVTMQCEIRARLRTELNGSWTMARNEKTDVPEFLIPFQVDQSWYERYWWQDSAPRKPGIFAFFRRILSQRLTRRQDVPADHEIPHSQKCPIRTTSVSQRVLMVKPQCN
jgi:hypothetical protein